MIIRVLVDVSISTVYFEHEGLSRESLIAWMHSHGFQNYELVELNKDETISII